MRYAPTRFEQIASAFPLHLQRIAEAAYTFDPKGSGGWLHSAPSSEQSGGARWALYDAFDWSQTPEGACYWHALAEGAPRS